MKYLHIHKLLCFLIVVAFTIFEGILILILWVLCFTWNFKPEKNFWSKYHSAKYEFENRWGGYTYNDANIWQTIIRRYKRTFDMKNHL